MENKTSTLQDGANSIQQYIICYNNNYLIYEEFLDQNSSINYWKCHYGESEPLLGMNVLM